MKDFLQNQGFGCCCKIGGYQRSRLFRLSLSEAAVDSIRNTAALYQFDEVYGVDGNRARDGKERQG